MHVAIVAGELSGDLLGAGLMAALRVHDPQLRFTGIGGPAMLAQGFQTVAPMERLAVMGLVEVVRHLPDLLALRRQLYRQFVADPPLAFVGIDAPDFNLGLERRLRAHGIPTVHYVSPSVWAWRPWRVRKIARAVDGQNVVLRVHPDVAKVLKSNSNRYLEELEEILKRPVLVTSDPAIHHEKFDLA